MMTDRLPPKSQRTLCAECRTDTFRSPEAYTYENWHASTCSRSRKYHRRQALLRQPGVTTYRDGQMVSDVPLPKTDEASRRQRRPDPGPYPAGSEGGERRDATPRRPPCAARAAGPGH